MQFAGPTQENWGIMNYSVFPKCGQWALPPWDRNRSDVGEEEGRVAEKDGVEQHFKWFLIANVFVNLYLK